MSDSQRSNTSKTPARLEYGSDEHHSRTTVDQIAQSYLESLILGDRVEALRILREDSVGAGLSIGQMYLNVIQHAQYEIGRLWSEGRVSISQEHVATGISQQAIALVYSLMPKSKQAGYRVLISCVPGETHDMGTRILADFFEMAGFDVRNLGADVPVPDIIEAVRQYEPAIVALSATMSYNLPAFEQAVMLIRSEFDESVLVAAGGQAFHLTPELLDDLNIPIRASDAHELVNQARAALKITP